MSDKEIRMLTKNELVAEYERTIKWYKEHNINRNFSKYAEMFWILFDDGANSYMWAIDTICSWGENGKGSRLRLLYCKRDFQNVRQRILFQ